MRLIDADALKSAIDGYMKLVYDCPLNEVADFQQCTTNIKMIYTVEGLYEATEIIDKAPTIAAVTVDKIHFTDLYLDGSEAIAVFKFGNHGITLRKKCEGFAPVVHGRWGAIFEKLWNVEFEVVTGFECSNCGHLEGFELNYCPNCGAKMDGGNDAENH